MSQRRNNSKKTWTQPKFYIYNAKKTKQAQQNETDPAQQPKQRKQLILTDSKNIFT